MTASSAKTGTIGLSLALDNNYMEPIATTLVGSGGVNNITFSDIPQGYKHLQIRAICLSASGGATDMKMQFNSDAGTNYSYHSLYGSGSAAGATAGTTTSRIIIGANGSGNSSYSNYFAANIIDILDYSNTNKYKTVRALSGFDTNNATTNINNETISLSSGLWQSTLAVNSITLANDTGVNFVQYSRFSLYGVKG